MWTEKKLREKLIYMHNNPLQRKLVSHPRDWPWSSWSFYEKGEREMIRIDGLRPEMEEMERKSQNPHPYKTKGAAPKLT